MKNLLQQQEREFDSKFPQKLIRKSINWGLEDDPRNDIKSLLLSQKIELLNEVVKWCKKRCEDNIRINGTDKWNSDLEDLIFTLQDIKK